RQRADLGQDREQVAVRGELHNPPVAYPHQVPPGALDGSPRGRYTREVALVGSGVGDPGADEVTLLHQVSYLRLQVRKRVEETRCATPVLVHRRRRGTGMSGEIGGDNLVEHVQLPGTPDLVEPPCHALLVALHDLSSSLVRPRQRPPFVAGRA